jgi:hypothetical protein
MGPYGQLLNQCRSGFFEKWDDFQTVSVKFTPFLLVSPFCRRCQFLTASKKKIGIGAGQAFLASKRNSRKPAMSFPTKTKPYK